CARGNSNFEGMDYW
nr:immunoglobulin heavy chain junction region [Mus musculus]